MVSTDTDRLTGVVWDFGVHSGQGTASLVEDSLLECGHQTATFLFLE